MEILLLIVVCVFGFLLAIKAIFYLIVNFGE